jgi:hypothetical protein
MFTLDNMRTLRNARRFIRFRLHLSDGSTVDIPSRELAFPGR